MKIEKFVFATFIIGIIMNPIFQKVGVATFWPSLALLYIVFLLKYSALFLKPVVLLSIAYVSVLFYYDINGLFKELNFPLGNFSLFLPFLTVSLMQEVTLKLNSVEFKMFLGKVIFYALTAMSVVSLFTLISNPLAARGVFAETEVLLIHSFVGFYFLALIAPLPFLNWQLKPDLTNILLALNVIVLVLSGFSGAIFLALLTALVIFYSKLNKRQYFVKGALLLGFALIAANFNVLIDIVLNVLPSDIAEIKKIEVSDVDFSSLNGFLETYRVGVYYTSWFNFLDSPLFGNRAAEFGHHSGILDKLGLFGFVGTGLILLIYFFLYRNGLRLVRDVNGAKFLRTGMLILFIALVMNPLDSYHMQFFYFYFFFLPLTSDYFLTR